MSHLTNYDLVYLITNIFGVYILYKFMGVFFDRTHVQKKQEILSYLAYFVLISLVHLVINIPIVTMVCNLAAFWIISLNYPAGTKKRLSDILLIYLVIMMVETIAVVLSGYLHFSILDSQRHYSSITGLLVIKIITYIVVLGIENYKNIGQGGNISNVYWLAIFSVPLGMLYLILVMLESNSLAGYHMMIYLVIGLLIMIMIFYLYDAINRVNQEILEATLIKQQNQAYQKQLDLMTDTNKRADAIRHDTQNYILVLTAYLENNQTVEALAYLSQFLGKVNQSTPLAKSDLVYLDSLINFKNHQAQEQGITLDLQLEITEPLVMTSLDLVTVLGNLLDNALEATAQVMEEKRVHLAITYGRGLLFITISNPYQGQIKYQKGQIVTSKTNSKDHGLGLSNVRHTLDKYDATLQISTENQTFKVVVKIYI